MARHGWLLFLVSSAMLIVSLDQYIVVVALPAIGRALGYSAQTLQLVVSAYAVASSGFLLLGGRAADLLGQASDARHRPGPLRRRLVRRRPGHRSGHPARRPGRPGPRRRTGLPRDPGIINTTYAQGRERNRALGIWGAAGAAGLVVGVLWQAACSPATSAGPSVFFINVPLALAALAWPSSWFRGPAARPDPPVRPGRCAHRDGAVTLVVWALVQGPQLGGAPPRCSVPVGPRPGPRLGVHQDRAASPRSR